MTKTLTLMQGIPASGKSAIAQALAKHYGDVRVCSTDSYWGSHYDFKPELLGRAHGWNQANVAQAMHEGVQVIVVDNTNLSVKDMAPYCELAQEHGYDVQVVTVDVPLGLALERNAKRPPHRQVPEDTIRTMHARLRSNQQSIQLYLRGLHDTSADSASAS